MPIFKRLDLDTGNIFLCTNCNDAMDNEFLTWCLEENVAFFNVYKASPPLIMRDYIIYTEVLTADQLVIATLVFDIDTWLYDYDYTFYKNKHDNL